MKRKNVPSWTPLLFPRRRLGKKDTSHKQFPKCKVRIFHITAISIGTAILFFLRLSWTYYPNTLFPNMTSDISSSMVLLDARYYLSLKSWLKMQRKQLQHRPGKQYTLSFRRRNGQWKHPLREWTKLSVEDLKDLVPILGLPPEQQQNSRNNESSSLGIVPQQPPKQQSFAHSVEEAEYALDLLAAAGVTHVDWRIVQALPSGTTWTRLYGGGTSQSSLLYGCPPLDPQFEEYYVGVAGLFNTGTTALELYLKENLQLPTLETAKEVPWGKHRLWSLRHAFMPTQVQQLLDQTTNDTHRRRRVIIPIVIIRDPFTWMQSMCTSPYMAKWPHTKAHCPNLVANRQDVEYFPGTTTLGQEIPTVLTAQNRTQFATLLDLWIAWYAQYLHSAEPRILVRFEDILIQPDAVVEQIRQCLHLEYHTTTTTQEDHFTYALAAVKWDQKYVKPQSSLVSALIKHGNGWGRTRNLTREDWHVIHRQLTTGDGATLVSTFNYLVGE